MSDRDQDPAQLFHEVQSLLSEVQRRRDPERLLTRKERLAELRRLSAEPLDPAQEELLRDYVRAVLQHGDSPTLSAADPEQLSPEFHALIAGAAGRELEGAETKLKSRGAELTELLNRPTGAQSKDSDAVQIAKINAAVEKERMARQHVQALRKIAADERTASLSLEIKRLEGEQQQDLAKINNANARAVAAENRASQFDSAKIAAENALALEKKKNEGLIIVEGNRGKVAVIVAAIGVFSASAGAAVTSCAKRSADSTPGATTAAPTTSAQVIATPRGPDGGLLGTRAGSQAWIAANCPAGTVFHELVQRGGDSPELRDSPVVVWECLDTMQRKQGRSAGWYDGGDRVALEWNYRDGQLDGEHRVYAKNGAIRRVAWYSMGRASGWRVDNDEFGRFARAECFENGISVGSTSNEADLRSSGERAVGSCVTKLVGTQVAPSAPNKILTSSFENVLERVAKATKALSESPCGGILVGAETYRSMSISGNMEHRCYFVFSSAEGYRVRKDKYESLASELRTKSTLLISDGEHSGPGNLNLVWKLANPPRVKVAIGFEGKENDPDAKLHLRIVVPLQ